MSGLVNSERLTLRRLGLVTSSAVVGLLAFGGPAMAGGVLPTGGQFVAGQGSIASGSGGLTITQTGSHGIINWNSFSVGTGNSVFFNNGSGATLNRVTGSSGSLIAGSLGSTGSVYLINPNGVVVSGSGRVVTGGSFVASTRDLSDSDFLAGGSQSFSGTSGGTIINQGRIAASTGDVVLIGKSVTNAGTISATKGTAALAAGDKVVLQPVGSDQRIAIAAGSGNVTNSGTVDAAAAELKAADGNVYALAGNNGGVVRATGTSTVAGHVWLTAAGDVEVTGTTAASNADGSGGAVTARGANITVSGTVDASATATAQTGGTVSIIAAKATRVSGTIKAKGGVGAKGGSIETSGGELNVDGATVDAGGGSWLLDPYNLELTSAAATSISNALNAGGGTNVTITTRASGTTGGFGTQTSGHGDITLDANAIISWTAPSQLTLSAYRNIQFNGIISTSAGSLVLGADNTGTGTGAVAFGSSGYASSNNAISILYDPSSYATPTTYTTGAGHQIRGTGIFTAFMLVNGLGQFLNIPQNLSGNYALGADIDANGFAGYAPIGDTTTPYSGIFDGEGHTISNLSIAAAQNGTGLFGATSATSIVRNITLTNVSVSAGDSASYVGAIIGENAGGLVNAAASGSITTLTNSVDIGGLVGYNKGSGSYVNGSHSAVAVTVGTTFTNVGGLVGNNEGEIYQSDASGLVTGGTGGSYLGGLAGTSNGTIMNSYATGGIMADTSTYVGGFAGFATGTVTDSYATGNVTDSSTTANNHNPTFVGGFAGRAEGTFTNDYATGAVSGPDSGGELIGGFAGYSQNATITNSYASGNVTAAGAFAVGGFEGEFDGGTLNGDRASGSVTVGDSATYVGGFSGFNGGTIKNSWASGALSTGSGAVDVAGFVGWANNGSSTTTSYATGAITVTTGANNVGGFIGISDGAVSNSYASGAIQADDGSQYIGGFVGHLDLGSITDAYAIGGVKNAANGALKYVGSFAGYVATNTTVTRAYGTGPITSAAAILDSGGFVGYNDGTISASFWDSTTTGRTSGTGGGTNAGFSAVSSSSAYTPSTYTNAGWTVDQPGSISGNTWFMVANQTRPFLSMEYSSTITNAHQLELISIHPTNAITLGNDIDLSGDLNPAGLWNPAHGFAPVGTSSAMFSGSLDGKNFTISNLTEISAANYSGLFGELDPSAIVSNLTLANVNISPSGAAGALAGYDHGATVTNVHSSGTITANVAGGLEGYGYGQISQSSSSVSVNTTANGDGGGLVGVSYGTIDQSFATGAVNSGSGSATGGLVGGFGAGQITNSYALGPVASGDGSGSAVGGLVGSDFGNGTIAASYSTGSVSYSGAGYIGGLVGYNGDTSGTQIQNSYFDTATSGLTAAVGAGSATGITGLTTAQLQSALPSGFSAPNWAIVGGVSFPYLSWQAPTGTPQVISGTISGETSNVGLGTGLLVDGVLVTPLAAMASGADGYYYDLVAPATIASSGSQVATYLAGAVSNAVTFGQDQTGSITGLNLLGNYLSLYGDAPTLSGLAAGYNTALANNNISANVTSVLVNDSASSFAMDILIYAPTGTVSIIAAGAITQTDSGGFTAGTLTGSSVGGVSLTAAGNNIGTLAGFTSGGPFALTDASTLVVTGTVSSGANALTLITTGSGHDLNIHGTVTTSKTMTLKAGGAISQTSASKLHAANLTGSSHDGAALTSNLNTIGTLDAFTSGGQLTLVNNAALTVSDTVSAATALRLTTRGSGNGLKIQGTLSAATTMALTSAGAISETGTAKVHAATLSGSSHGNTTLTSALNTIGNLSLFTSTGQLAVTDNATLTVFGTVSSGAGQNMTLTTVGAGHDLAINDPLFATNILTLTSSGAISETGGGAITAATLAGSSVGGTVLNGTANNIATLAGFASGNAFALTDAAVLTVSGPVSSASGKDLTLTTTGTGDDLDIQGQVTAGGVLTLVSGGAINETGAGVISAANLTGSSVGSALLNASTNNIATMSAFTSGAAFGLTDNATLTVSGAMSTVGGLSLTTVGAGHNLSLRSHLKVGTVLDLVSAGTMAESGNGVLTAATLKGSSVGDATLTAATNAVDELDAFTTANGDLSLTSAASLQVAGAINTGTGTLSLTTKGSGHNLAIAATVRGATVNLVSAGNVHEPSNGKIITNLINVTAATGITLTQPGNAIQAIGTNHTTSGPDTIN